jgi:hypothetical protein
MKHHFSLIKVLTSCRNPAEGPCQRVSLTGAVSSQRVTEEYEAWLSTVGNRTLRIWLEARLTVRQTSRADTKVGPSDPAVECGIAVAHRTKGTPGITGLSGPRVHIDGPVWHLDVGSSHPGAGEGPKGPAVRRLKRYASWVQNVVRQFGPYPLWAQQT